MILKQFKQFKTYLSLVPANAQDQPVKYVQNSAACWFYFCNTSSQNVSSQTFLQAEFKGNTTQVVELSVLYEFEPPIQKKHPYVTTNWFTSYQCNKMKCQYGDWCTDFSSTLLCLIVNINEYQTIEK